MESITLNGITFRWNDDDLIITTQTGQELLTGSDAALLLDFLQLHQQMSVADYLVEDNHMLEIPE